MVSSVENNKIASTEQESSNSTDTPLQPAHWGRRNEDSLEYGRELDKRAMKRLAEMKRKGLIP